MFLCLLRLKCDCWLCWSPAVCCCLSAEFLLQILQSQSAPVTSVNIYLHRERGLSSGHHHTGGCSVVPGVTTDVCRDVECKLWQGTVWGWGRVPATPQTFTPAPHCPLTAPSSLPPLPWPWKYEPGHLAAAGPSPSSEMGHAPWHCTDTGNSQDDPPGLQNSSLHFILLTHDKCGGTFLYPRYLWCKWFSERREISNF